MGATGETDHNEGADETQVPGEFARVLSWLLESRGIGVEAAAESIDLPAAKVRQWITAGSEPSPAEVFALERSLDIQRGILSRHLGYVPNDTKPVVTETQLAIATDPMLPEFGKQILLFTYRNLIGAGAPEPAIAATASDSSPLVGTPGREDARPDAERIRARRMELGISQRFVAERLGVSQPLVSKWENGERSLDELQLLRLCRVLRIDYRGLAAEMAREPLPPYRKASHR